MAAAAAVPNEPISLQAETTGWFYNTLLFIPSHQTI